jgi:hypothetical protein
MARVLLTWSDLARSLEEVVATQIASCTKDLWDENHITYNLVRAIRNVLSGSSITGDREKASIEAAVYKARGKVETRFGDLALLLKFTFRDGTELQGVAFYECKKREWDTHKLAAIQKKQLTRIHTNLWNARLLIYDREPIISSAFEAGHYPWLGPLVHAIAVDNDELVPTHPLLWPVLLPVMNAGVVPLGPVLATGRYDTSLYKFALPFSYQISFRNLQGLDLEYDAEIVAATKGMSHRYSVPKTVLAVSVRRGPGGPPTPPDINGDSLEAIQE